MSSPSPFTVMLDPDLHDEIEAARVRLALACGGEKPSAASVARRALRVGLPALAPVLEVTP